MKSIYKPDARQLYYFIVRQSSARAVHRFIAVRRQDLRS